MHQYEKKGLVFSQIKKDIAAYSILENIEQNNPSRAATLPRSHHAQSKAFSHVVKTPFTPFYMSERQHGVSSRKSPYPLKQSNFCVCTILPRHNWIDEAL